MYPDQLSLPEEDSALTQGAVLDGAVSRIGLTFEQMFERHNPMVFNLAYQILGNREEALDVAQEVFLAIYRNMNSFRGESSLKTWIYRIAVRRATNRYRWWNRLRRRGTVSLEEHLSKNPERELASNMVSRAQSPEEALLIQEERQEVRRMLQGLPLPQRIAVILRDMEGLSYEEIAESLHVSLGTIKSRIARGREALKHQLAG